MPSAKPKAEQQTASRGDDRLIIVGIGASAGGLEAIEAFFQQMDPQSGMAFVLVQHLDPTHKSILSELVGRFSKMPVQEVTQSLQVEANHVYVIPPNRDLAILNKRLQLLDPTGPRHLRLSIDYFFRSLAQEARDSAVGIVLSGTGTDGTLGVRAIKGEGGLVLVQDPATAAYDGMPRSAIATGIADAVLQPAEMARQLLAYARNATFPYTVPSSGEPESLDERERLFVLLRSQTGHDFSLYKEATITRRIQRRMTINGIDKESDFIRLLQKSPAEVDALWKEFLIRVTQFFRDQDAFDALGAGIIPELLKRKNPDEELRIWVPACSTGEEVYSIAMLIHEHLEHTGATRDVQIVIPAPAYSEALSSRARQERVAAIATLRAPVVPLDAHSAEIAADLHLAWRLAHPGNMNQDEKSVVRIDAFIAGIAVQPQTPGRRSGRNHGLEEAHAFRADGLRRGGAGGFGPDPLDRVDAVQLPLQPDPAAGLLGTVRIHQRRPAGRLAHRRPDAR